MTLPEKIIAKYKENLSIYKTGEYFNINPVKVWRYLNKYNIIINKSKSHQKFEVNENFLNIIDHESKAYLIGLIYADGTLDKRGSCTITLTEDDGEILEILSKYIFKNRPLRKVKGQKMKSPLNGKEYQSKDSLQLSFCNQNLYKNLIKYGLFPNKSLSIKLPSFDQIPVDFYHHFLRGYFDGDGSIFNIKNTTRYGFNLLGSDYLINDLFLFFKNMNINTKLNKEGKISAIRCYSKIEIRKIYEYLYKNATIYLKRKKSKFLMMIDNTNWDSIEKLKYSKQIGVTFDKRRNKWYATKKINKKVYWLGSFLSEEEAIKARLQFDTNHKFNSLISLSA